MQDPKSIVLCSAISEVFLRRLAKQNYIKYVEGSEFLDTRDDLIDMGDPDGGGLKEMDEKLKKYNTPLRFFPESATNVELAALRT